MLERGVHGDIGDPHGQRDLLPPRAPQLPLPVPALGEGDEQAVHRARQTEPLGEHLAYLAERDHMRPAVPCRLRKPTRDLDRARRRRAIGIRERAHDRGQELALRSEQHGPEARLQITAEDLGGDLRIGSAAAIREQARVVGLRCRLRIDSKTLAQPHRDLRCVQTVLERKAHGDVRRQAQRRHHLGSAHALPAAELLFRHVATLPQPAGPPYARHSGSPRAVGQWARTARQTQRSERLVSTLRGSWLGRAPVVTDDHVGALASLTEAHAFSSSAGTRRIRR